MESREQAEGYAAAKGQLLAIIEQRAEEKAELLVAARLKALRMDGETDRRGEAFSACAGEPAAFGAADAAGTESAVPEDARAGGFDGRYASAGIGEGCRGP
jgi:hypothetical protein